MEDIYSKAKIAGYNTVSVLEQLFKDFLDSLEQELDRELTEDERDEAYEGFWNGVI